MIGSPAVAGFIAHAAFWTLLTVGIVRGLGIRTVVVFVALWIAGRVGLPYVLPGLDLCSCRLSPCWTSPSC
jgi:hypothetical protein